MGRSRGKRLNQIARELNVGIEHLREYLAKKGHGTTDMSLNERISEDSYQLLLEKFSSDKEMNKRLEQKKQTRHSKRKQENKQKNDEIQENNKPENETEAENEETVLIHDPSSHTSDSDIKQENNEQDKQEENKQEEEKGLKVLGKIELDENKNPVQPENKVKKEESLPEKNTKEADKKQESVNEPKEKTENEKEEEIPEGKTENEKQKEIPEEKKKESQNKQSDITSDVKKKDFGPKVIDTVDLSKFEEKPKNKKTRKERKEENLKRKKASEKAILEAKQKRMEQKEAEAEKLKKQKEEKEAMEKNKEQKENFIETKVKKLEGPKIVKTIELPEEKKPKKKGRGKSKKGKEKRNRIKKPKNKPANLSGKGGRSRSNQSKDKKGKKTYKKSRNKRGTKPVQTEEDINKKIKETMSDIDRKKQKRKKKRLSSKDKKKKIEQTKQSAAKDEKTLKVTEYISVKELAAIMDVEENDIIRVCFQLDKMVTVTQRLDADIIALIADEFGYKDVEYLGATENELADKFEDDEENLVPRQPIVTVMGHVDHGKTSLLDYIRKTKVIEGEAGGITQHIAAYSVKYKDSKITFLDTPGHEAFTAMRSRGASVTDIAVIIIAADDGVMPQTEEAISHAKAADVPIIFAINKIDLPGADPESIKRQLAERNMLVEKWGGKYQSTDISAKQGLNVEDLLEEITTAAEVLELEADPDRPAKGAVIEASLRKGKGYVSTLLVQTGTLREGDMVLAGSYSGKVKAMFNEYDKRVENVGPAQPALVLGLDGAPAAGETFYVLKNEREARSIAAKNKRIQREQSFRAQKHITLEEIGRRIKIGGFQELNVIIKGDVMGTVDAIASSLMKLSTDEIGLNVIHKGVGQINEADVSLAAASDAIIIGFQVRPSHPARKLAEKEEIDVRLYSVIFHITKEVKDAMEGMLSPEIKEEITGTAEVRKVYKITKVGKIAGCFVLDGKIGRKDKVRLIRDGIVIYTGQLDSLKRFKDDVREVAKGYECGLNIKNYEDIKVDDIIEAYKETEIAKTL